MTSPPPSLATSTAQMAEAEEMPINPQRAKQLAESFTQILHRVQSANKTRKNVRIVLVSKLKPANDILALHTAPTLSPAPAHFGENYAQELAEKAKLLPKSIKWHFIGALQTNKCKPLAEGIPNLWCVESVDSAKKADALEKGRRALVERLKEEAQQAKKKEQEKAQQAGDGADNGVEDKLRIMVQVNTSGEASKSGVEPSDALDLCRHVRDKCPHLRLQGLMTIGAIARSQATTAETENEDFVRLKETRDRVAEGLGVDKEQLELSMGMSNDFEGAVRMGSDEVRVGSAVFGERPARGDAKVKEDVEEGKG